MAKGMNLISAHEKNNTKAPREPESSSPDDSAASKGTDSVSSSSEPEESKKECSIPHQSV